MSKTFQQLVKEHAAWAAATFPKGTAQGALIHAMREVQEIVVDFEEGATKESKSLELADFFGCIINAGSRYGVDTESIAIVLDFLCESDIKLTDIRQAFNHKLQINMARKWKDNGDGSYSHIKAEEIREILPEETTETFLQKLNKDHGPALDTGNPYARPISENNSPMVIERFGCNGEHSHWELINSTTGEVLWKQEETEVTSVNNCLSPDKNLTWVESK